MPTKPQNIVSSLQTPLAETQGEIVLYQPNNQLSLEVKLEQDTVWLSQAQMALLFGVRENNITYHIKDIYRTNELTPESTAQKIRVVRNEGGRQVRRATEGHIDK